MKSSKIMAGLLAAGLLTSSLAACGSGGSADQSGSAGTDGSAGATPSADASGDLTVWGYTSQWDNGLKTFQEAYPNVKVNFTNTGTASDTATALSNAIQAGSGAPDVIMLEQVNFAQFALGGALDDLASYGADSLKDQFAAGPIAKLTTDGKLYGMPLDSAPMVFFYNEEVFTKAAITEAPKTWDEYYEAAKKIKALGDGHYITNDTGDKDSYSEFMAMLWQAGGQPFKASGSDVTINLTDSDAGVKKYAEFKQKLIDEDLVDTKSKQWSDDWFRGLGDGTIASLYIGAWMPSNLESGAEAAAGKWRAAPLPQWEAGAEVSAEDGGSGLGIVSSSKNKDAAWALIDHMTNGKGAEDGAAEGTVFPAKLDILNSDEFRNQENEYFGGQKVNEVLSDAANLKVSEFGFLPFNAYAQPKYGDIVSPAYTKSESMLDALQKFQDDLVTYGNSQGFSVNK